VWDIALALALIPTENQIFMACLDAHLYEIEYNGIFWNYFYVDIVIVNVIIQADSRSPFIRNFLISPNHINIKIGS
jgi:hypothetical protein